MPKPALLLFAALGSSASSLAETTAVSPASFDRARTTADNILARPEFRTVSQTSSVEKMVNLLVQWINNILTSVAGLGQREPWLASVLEWSFFALAAAALLVWGIRTMRRQRLTVLLESKASDPIWRKQSEDWADLARTQAAELAWRDAVHSLYWATIVMLEGRKFWRSNRARTPREYLQLLEPGSPRQQSLANLTRIFERIWYGQRPASESDYTRVLAFFEDLSAA